MTKLAQTFIHAFENGNKVIAIGCGGSNAQSDHFIGELLCKIAKPRKSLPAITLNNPSVITAIGNDFGFEYIFSRQLEALGNKGDILVPFTTSGKSSSIINAIATAKYKKMTVIEVPRIGPNTQDIQEFQLKWIHEICEEIEEHYL